MMRIFIKLNWGSLNYISDKKSSPSYHSQGPRENPESILIIAHGNSVVKIDALTYSTKTLDKHGKKYYHRNLILPNSQWVDLDILM